MINDPVGYKLCNKESRKDCDKIDKSKFVHKDSVPTCDLVLPQQYNLYKKRKGYDPDNISEDSTPETIINKENYIIFYIAFVILILLYVILLIFKSIF